MSVSPRQSATALVLIVLLAGCGLGPVRPTPTATTPSIATASVTGPTTIATETPVASATTGTSPALALSTPHESPSAIATAAPTSPAAPEAVSTPRTDLIADPPVRDLIDLQRRLRPRLTVTPLASGGPRASTAGSEVTFWVANQQTKSYFSMRAGLDLVTDHVYWFVEDGVDVPPTDLQSAATFFETQTYPTEHRLFGSEWSPGIDNDVHITVLLGHIPGVGGYFSTADEYPPAVNPYSNEREMIYINADAVRPGTGGFNGTVSHEFMHMIQFNVHRNQNSWINEGTAELAAQAVTGAVSSGVPSFERAPQTQLNGWSSEPSSSLPHYGAAYLFMRYIAEQFGGFGTVGRIVATPGRDVETFTPVFQSLQPPQTFEQVFADWVAANYLSDSTLANGRYGYKGLSLHVAVRPGPQLGQTIRGIANQLGITYYHVASDVPSQVRFAGATSVDLIGADPHQAQLEWWSNHGDSIDSRLTRSVDLTGVRQATLHFWIWFDIETGFDYGYVEASTDSGQTWTTLKATDTTAENPNGQNYGNGFTGEAGGKSQQWTPETVDLTPFAGHPILLRFEYVTDDSYNADGFAIDGVAIPEIGFQDNPDGNSGWVADGFTLIDNRLPQRYLVEEIDPSNPTPSSIIAAGPDGTATVDVPPGKAIVIAVGGLTTETTHASPYTLRMNPN